MHPNKYRHTITQKKINVNNFGTVKINCSNIDIYMNYGTAKAYDAVKAFATLVKKIRFAQDTQRQRVTDKDDERGKPLEQLRGKRQAFHPI